MKNTEEIINSEITSLKQLKKIVWIEYRNKNLQQLETKAIQK